MSRVFIQRITVATIAFVALLALAFPTQSGALAQVKATPDPKTVRDGVDLKFSAALADITSFQAVEAGKSGNFYQVLWSHSQPPADGALVVPDLLYSFPSDQIGKSGQAQWDAAKLPAALDARYRVDVYDGPSGKGFVVIMQSKLNGVIWQRSINYGPEAYRDQGWTEIKPVTP